MRLEYVLDATANVRIVLLFLQLLFFVVLRLRTVLRTESRRLITYKAQTEVFHTSQQSSMHSESVPKNAG